ncbi:MAG TPA: RNA methyltransferase [bacterium]|nr:RNA methyltransferase [bacterium]
MLSLAQEKLIRSLQTNKGRLKSGLWLVEGKKFIELAGSSVKSTFTAEDTPKYSSLTTTDTPPTIAAIATAPSFSLDKILAKKTILILDNIQDPGNLGTIMRLSAAFNAGLLLYRCVDPGNPKVIRSSAGTIFQVPWQEASLEEITSICQKTNRPIFRLEKTKQAKILNIKDGQQLPKDIILLAGSEGQGITLPLAGESLAIEHAATVESLNVATAVAIALFTCYQKA